MSIIDRDIVACIINRGVSNIYGHLSQGNTDAAMVETKHIRSVSAFLTNPDIKVLQHYLDVERPAYSKVRAVGTHNSFAVEWERLDALTAKDAIRDVHLERLRNMHRRMPMYIQPIERDTIVNFLSGYECAAPACHFTRLLNQHLQVHYGVSGGACGWPDAVETLAEQRGIVWLDAYRLVSGEMLKL